MAGETIERSFAVGAPARLMLGNVCGWVRVAPGPQGEIRVRAEIVSGPGRSAAPRIEMAQAADGSVRVATHYDSLDHWLGFRLRPRAVHYSVQVPPECALRVDGVSSDLEAHSLSGRFELSAVSGDIHTRDLSGDLRLSVVSGRIIGQQLTGELDLHTVSGQALVAGDFTRLGVNTVSGDVRLEADLAREPARLESVSGDVAWQLPAAAGCTVSLRTLSGGFLSDLPQAWQTGSGRHGVVQVLGGGPDIRFQSVSGSLRLGAARPAAGSHAVLERLARGEMTAEQALEALHA